MTSVDRPHPTVRAVAEAPSSRPPALVHVGWGTEFPWLVQGTTTRGESEPEFDMGLFAAGGPPAVVQARWGELRAAFGLERAVHARQVHGRRVSVHRGGPPGLEIVDPCDAHVTDRPGVLLAVATADCVPVFLVDPEARAVGVAHAGWRGAAAGVLEAAIAHLEGLGARIEEVRLHLGPSICGRCYEVGPEVHGALSQPLPSGPKPIDLRAILVERALSLGVLPAHATVSTHCTRCTGSRLFSHRGGDRGRQVGFLAIRPDGKAGRG